MNKEFYPARGTMRSKLPNLGWHESRSVNKERRTASRCIITYRGMNLSFEISCVWLIDRFKWILQSEALGIYSNLIGDAGKITKDQAKRQGVEMIKACLMKRVNEADALLED